MNSRRPLPAILLYISLLPACLTITTAGAQPASEARELLESYAEILAAHRGDDARGPPLAALLQQAENFRDRNPEDPEAMLVASRIRFFYADTQGILRAMQLLKLSRDELQRVVSIDPGAGDGIAQALLGFLYVAVPPWPLGFRDSEKSEQHFTAAMNGELVHPGARLNYALVLQQQKQYPAALEQVNLAQAGLDTMQQTPQLRALYSRTLAELRQALEAQIQGL